MIIDETAPPKGSSFTPDDDGAERYTQRQVGLEPKDAFIRDHCKAIAFAPTASEAVRMGTVRTKTGLGE